MAMSAEHRSKFAAFHRLWWRLHINENFSNGTEKSQTNKQTNKQNSYTLCTNLTIVQSFDFHG